MGVCVWEDEGEVVGECTGEGEGGGEDRCMGVVRLRVWVNPFDNCEILSNFGGVSLCVNVVFCCHCYCYLWGLLAYVGCYVYSSRQPLRTHAFRWRSEDCVSVFVPF